MDGATTQMDASAAYPEAWKNKVRDTTHTMIVLMRDEGHRAQDIRAVVIEAARLALSDRPSELVMEPLLAMKSNRSGREHLSPAVFAGMFRFDLDVFLEHWDGPSVAEAVLAEIRAATEEELASYHIIRTVRLMLLLAARLAAIEEYQRTPEVDRGMILGRVMDRAEVALDEMPSAPWVESFEEKGLHIQVVGAYSPPDASFQAAFLQLRTSDPEVRRAVLTTVRFSARCELAQSVPGQAAA